MAARNPAGCLPSPLHAHPHAHKHPHPDIPPGIDDTVKIWAPTAPERRPVPPEAHRVMERNREARLRPDRSLLPVPPELLRLLFSRRGRGAVGGSSGEEEEDAWEGREGDTDDGEEGCRVS